MPFTIEDDTAMEGLGATAPPQMLQRTKRMATNLATTLKKAAAAGKLPPFMKVKKKKRNPFSWSKPKATAAPAASSASKTPSTFEDRMRALFRAKQRRSATRLTQTGVRRAGAPSSFKLPRQIAGKAFPARPRAVVPQSVKAPLPAMGTPPLRSAIAYESIAKLFSKQGAFVPAAPSQELIASLYGLDYPGEAFVNSLTLPKKILLGVAAVGGLLTLVMLVRKMRGGGVSGIDAFTRRHYEDVAKLLRAGNASRSDVERWVEKFQADNPRFRADYFRAAVAGKKKDRSRH